MVPFWHIRLLISVQLNYFMLLCSETAWFIVFICLGSVARPRITLNTLVVVNRLLVIYLHKSTVSAHQLQCPKVAIQLMFS